MLDVAKKVEVLLESCRSLSRSGYLYLPTEEEGGGVESDSLEFGWANFSDTVVMWSPPIEATPARHVQHVGGSFLLVVASAVNHGLLTALPLRAGVAFGEVYLDEEHNILLGQPIVDAYLTESSQEWVGGALHSSCLLGTHLEPSDLMCAVEYPVPIKQGKSAPAAAVDWTIPARVAAAYFATKSPDYEWQPSTLLDPYIDQASDSTVRQKYINTKSFAEVQNRPVADDEP